MKKSRKGAVDEVVAVETPVEEAPVADPVFAEPPAPEPQGRDRIQQQLEALKQREAELRRELAIADHPALGDAIRAIEGSAYGVARIESKMAEGLTKAEQRRKETLEKKLASAKEKRAEIDAQIAALETELTPLGDARVAAFDAQRTQALLTLVEMLKAHDAALTAASLEIDMLVPTLLRWRVEIDALRAR